MLTPALNWDKYEEDQTGQRGGRRKGSTPVETLQVDAPKMGQHPNISSKIRSKKSWN